VKQCKIEGCELKVHGLKLCNLHYKRFKKYGDPHTSNANIRKYPTLKYRFIGSFIKKSDKECWPWIEAVSHGYGAMCWEGKRYSSSRYSYEHYIGPISKGMNVCHACDNPLCVNPNHLFLGTHKDNMDDKIYKKRHNHGNTHGMNKINSSIVSIIRLKIESGITGRAIAREYGLTESCISKIKNFKLWAV